MTKIVLWGAGGIADAHVKAFSYWKEDCEIVAVVNRTIARAEKVIERNALTARAYETMDEAVSAEHPDAVSVILPPMLHAEACEYAASKGLHVFMEKPMANSLAECDRMIRACKEAGVLLAVVCQMRFAAEVVKLRQLLTEERFGKLLYANANSYWWRGEQYHDLYWRGTWEKEGGGVLMIQAIHHLDLMLYLCGAPERVSASMANVGHFNSECEDVATLTLGYPDRYVQFGASMVAHGEETRLDFYTERGKLSYPFSAAASMAMENGFPRRDRETTAEIEKVFSKLPSPEAEFHTGQAGNFLRAIQGKEALVSDGEEGRRVIEVITAAYRAATDGCVVRLPMTPEDPFYTNEGKTKGLPHFHEKKKSVESMGDAPIVLAEEEP